MSITQTDTPCWHLIHTDGPAKGGSFETDTAGEAHYSTQNEAQATTRDEDAALEPRLVADTGCFTVKCGQCDYVLDEDDGAVHHHPTREDAMTAAMGGAWSERGDDLICPACNGA